MNTMKKSKAHIKQINFKLKDFYTRVRGFKKCTYLTYLYVVISAHTKDSDALAKKRLDMIGEEEKVKMFG